MRASIITTKVGSLTEAIEVASVICWARSSTSKLRFPPRSCKAIESWCTIDSTSRRLSIQSISLKRLVFCARSRGAAEQALDRGQHELRLDRHQYARPQRLEHHRDGQRVWPEAAPARPPR